MYKKILFGGPVHVLIDIDMVLAMYCCYKRRSCSAQTVTATRATETDTASPVRGRREPTADEQQQLTQRSTIKCKLWKLPF